MTPARVRPLAVAALFTLVWLAAVTAVSRPAGLAFAVGALAAAVMTAASTARATRYAARLTDHSRQGRPGEREERT